MAVIWNSTITASGNTIMNLNNTRGVRNIYTVHATGTFGGGTLTLFTNPEGSVAAAAGTTYDVALLDALGNPISYTSNGAFDFECNSDPEHPTVLKVILTGATSPSLKLKVCDIQ